MAAIAKIGRDMAKLSDKPLTQSDIKDFVETQDDFGLELAIYSHCRDLGFEVSHGGSYVDRVTGKTRQYDVRAIAVAKNQIRHFMSIECKCLGDSFPLLVSRIPRLSSESYQESIAPPGIVGTTHNVHPSVTKLGIEDLRYPPNAYVGKSIVQVGKTEAGNFSSNNAEIYDKWGQALSSAHALVGEAMDGKYSASPRKQVVVPILVVSDGTLWVADYSENGTLQTDPTQADHAHFYVGEEYTWGVGWKYKISHLHIFTKSGAKEYFKSLIA